MCASTRASEIWQLQLSVLRVRQALIFPKVRKLYRVTDVLVITYTPSSVRAGIEVIKV